MAKIHIKEHVDTAINVFVNIVSTKINGVEQVDDYRLKFAKGSTTDFVIEIQDSEGNVITHVLDAAGNPVPNNDHFAFPIEGLLGSKGRTIGADVVEGVTQLSVVWSDDGEWQITEEALNMFVDSREIVYKFKGLHISVYE